MVEPEYGASWILPENSNCDKIKYQLVIAHDILMKKKYLHYDKIRTFAITAVKLFEYYYMKIQNHDLHY